MLSLQTLAMKLGATTACALLLITTAFARADERTPRTFDIGPQSLATALSEYARQSQQEILFAPAIVADKTTEGLRGVYPPLDALKRILGETGLTFSTTPSGAILVQPTAAGSDSSRTPSAPQAFNSSETPNSAPAKKAGWFQRFRLAQNEPSTPTDSSSSREEKPSQSSDKNSEGRVIEEVIVTAQKRIERLQDVPVPVTTISGETLAANNQLRVQDYYSKIPGLGFTLAGNGNEPVLAIRGITTGGSALGANPTVGIVIDEVAYGASVATGAQIPAVPDIDPGDLARVEVLRGPQGTLYGASSIGGLLKFVTVDPSTDAVRGRVQIGTASVSDSDDLGYSARGSLNVPLGDTFAMRASAFTTRDPGYVDNAETGQRDANRRDSEGARLAALWQPSNAFSLKLSALYQDSERRGAEEIDTALGGDPAQAFLRESGIYSRQAEAYGATATGTLGSVELTSATGYSIDKLTDNVDLTNFLGGIFAARAQTFFGVNRAVVHTDATVKKFTQEIRASLAVGQRVNWLVGAFYTDEDTNLVVDTQAADSTGAVAGSINAFRYRDGVFEEYAAFTNVTVDVTDRWDIQFGGRFSDQRQSYPLVRDGARFNPPRITPPIKSESSAFTYLVTPRFKFSPDLMLYARLASGYRPGGPNSLCGNVGVPCSFDADKTQNYDIGVKGSIGGGMLAFDASVYYIDWKDLQLIGIRTPDGLSQYTGNASRAESQGVELSLESRLSAGLIVSAWAAYNKAELVEAFPPGLLFGEPGDRLPYSSRFSGNLSLEQSFPLWSNATGFIGGTLAYVGDRVGDFKGTSTRQTYPSYTQIDLRAGMSYESWTLDIFVNNATDERGVLRTGLDSVFVPSYTNYIQPRTMGLSLGKSF